MRLRSEKESLLTHVAQGGLWQEVAWKRPDRVNQSRTPLMQILYQENVISGE